VRKNPISTSINGCRIIVASNGGYFFAAAGLGVG